MINGKGRPLKNGREMDEPSVRFTRDKIFYSKGIQLVTVQGFQLVRGATCWCPIVKCQESKKSWCHQKCQVLMKLPTLQHHTMVYQLAWASKLAKAFLSKTLEYSVQILCEILKMDGKVWNFVFSRSCLCCHLIVRTESGIT